MSLRLLVSDLLSKPGETRSESATLPISFELQNARVDDVASVESSLTSLSDGIVARGRASVTAKLVCNRCLTGWETELEVVFEQVYRLRPQDADEEMLVEQGAWIDLEAVVHDELSLAVPLTPLCRIGCLGLCPTCGTDLNVEPCAGHGEESSSPFAALRELFETDSST